MSYPRHRVGDIVRLAKGWTPMTVIGLTSDDQVIAKYGTNPDRKDLRHPEYALSTYTRPHFGFVHWDGEPLKESMMKTYQINDGTFRQGKFLNRTSNGAAFVLEFPDGTVEAFDPCDLTEIIPETFLAKAMGSNYPAHYLVPEGVTLKVNDMLLSSTGNVYVVRELNTKCRNPKGVFSGVRIVTKEL